MRADRHPRAVQQQITVESVGGETLLYDARRHVAFCLNRTAAEVWRHVDGTRSVAEVAAAVGRELGADVDIEVVQLAIDGLRENGLMEDEGDAMQAEPHAAVVRRRGLSRRSMLRLGAGAAAMLPAIASIVAPTAAQAYSGCVDCSVASPRRARRSGTPSISPLGDQ